MTQPTDRDREVWERAHQAHHEHERRQRIMRNDDASPAPSVIATYREEIRRERDAELAALAGVTGEDVAARALEAYHSASPTHDGPSKAHASIITEALAAAVAKGAQWQPIETAPKGGTEFLSWSAKHGRMVCNQPDEFHVRGNWTYFPSERRWRGAVTDAIFATHWIHLPAPPIEAGAHSHAAD